MNDYDEVMQEIADLMKTMSLQVGVASSAASTPPHAITALTFVLAALARTYNREDLEPDVEVTVDMLRMIFDTLGKPEGASALETFSEAFHTGRAAGAAARQVADGLLEAATMSAAKDAGPTPDDGDWN